MPSGEVTGEMYNRYLDPECQPLSTPPPAPEQKAPKRSADPLGDFTASLGELLGGFFKKPALSDIDTGDILLVLIILFLYLEGDNLELVIILGLMLLLSLGGE